MSVVSKSKLVQLSDGERSLVDTALSHYDLPAGERNILRNMVGYVNKTYIVETKEGEFVLRQSGPLTTPEHLEFEVEVLRYLENVGYGLSPRLLANKDGAYLTSTGGSFWMLQNFIPGEIRASWNDTAHFEGEMLRNFFRASAEFTKAAAGFRPSRKYKNEPLAYYLKNARPLFDGLLDVLPESVGKKYLHSEREDLLHFAETTNTEFGSLGYDALPKQLVHFDFHPGNVHYSGDAVVGLFDFDWARMDCRITDIGTTIGQSCYAYGGPATGTYIKEKIADGMAAYRGAYGPSEFEPTLESRLIVAGLKGFMFFQMFWAGHWYKENIDHEEGSFILQHFRNVCLENDYDALFS